MTTHRLVSPPTIYGPNPMPLDWRDPDARVAALADQSHAQTYDPRHAVPWTELDRNEFSAEQQVAIAYWLAVDGTFENSGAPTFAEALVSAYEQHLGHSAVQQLLTIARDESNHDYICRRVAQTMLPDFPHAEAGSELHQRAQNNLQWISYTNSKYWSGYRKALTRHPVSTIVMGFMMGEAAASLIFNRTAELAGHPVFATAFRLIGRDESRHYAFARFLAEATMPSMTEDERQMLTKNIRASFIYISVLLDTPQPPFWDVPDYFVDNHAELEQIARAAGVGIPTIDERRQMWRGAALRVKQTTDRYGVEFPALPEVGISGKETALTEADLLIATF